jgi:hypothetical protein
MRGARDHDCYNRTIAECRTETREIDAAMVRRGWAVDYSSPYRSEGAGAKAEGLRRTRLPEPAAQGCPKSSWLPDQAPYLLLARASVSAVVPFYGPTFLVMP